MTSSLVSLGSGWSKLASSGQNIVVYNPGSQPVVITTSSAAPTGTAGVQLAPGEKQSGTLLGDLYGRSDGGTSVILADGFFKSFSAGATTPATSAGGGASNTADFSDPNNAYLIALAA